MFGLATKCGLGFDVNSFQELKKRSDFLFFRSLVDLVLVKFFQSRGNWNKKIEKKKEKRKTAISFLWSLLYSNAQFLKGWVILLVVWNQIKISNLYKFI